MGAGWAGVLLPEERGQRTGDHLLYKRSPTWELCHKGLTAGSRMLVPKPAQLPNAAAWDVVPVERLGVQRADVWRRRARSNCWKSKGDRALSRGGKTLIVLSSSSPNVFHVSQIWNFQRKFWPLLSLIARCLLECRGHRTGAVTGLPFIWIFVSLLPINNDLRSYTCGIYGLSCRNERNLFC